MGKGAEELSEFETAINKPKRQLKNQASWYRLGRSIRFMLTVLVLTLVVPGIFTSASAATQSEIKVQYNGNNIIFTDASPKIIDDRTIVPFRQILETMGATVIYEPNTQIITAKTNDRQFSFSIGSPQINIIKNGQTITKQMDVLPYLDPETNRTYVPARFMAESLDYSVGWDDLAKTAVIIDFKAIFANADRDFSVVAKLLDTGVDPKKAYATTGDFDLSLFIYEPTISKEGLNVSLTGDISGIQQKNNMDFIINFFINAEQILSLMPADQQANIKPVLDRLEKAQIKMKLDGEAGVIYYNTNLAGLIDPEFNDNTWIRQDFKAVYDEMGINYQSILDFNSAKPSPSELLSNIFMSSGNLNLNTRSYQETKTAYLFLKNLIGDESFDLQTVNGIKTWTLKLDQAALLDAITKTALTAGNSAADLSQLKQDWPDDLEFQVKLVISEQGEVLKSYTLEGTSTIEGIFIDLYLTGNQNEQQLELAIKENGVIELDLGLNSSWNETNQRPDLKFPAGAKIIDVNQL